MTKNFLLASMALVSSFVQFNTLRAQGHGNNESSVATADARDPLSTYSKQRAELLGTLIAKLNELQRQSPTQYNVLLKKLAAGTEIASLNLWAKEAANNLSSGAVLAASALAVSTSQYYPKDLNKNSALKGSASATAVGSIPSSLALYNTDFDLIRAQSVQGALSKLSPSELQAKMDVMNTYLSSLVAVSPDRAAELKNKLDTQAKLGRLQNGGSQADFKKALSPDELQRYNDAQKVIEDLEKLKR